MIFFVWACMWTSAFFPSAASSALQTASAIHAQSYAPALNLSPARQIASKPLISPEPSDRPRERMTLGWVSEDDAPIF